MQLAGQAWRLAGGRLHRLGQLALSLLLLLLLGVAALAWRLDQGPLPLPWLAHRLQAMAARRGMALEVGTASLAWAGFSQGWDAPLRLVLLHLRLPPPDRLAPPPAELASAAASFALPGLLAGRLVPRAVALDGLRLSLSRGVDGALRLGTQPAPGPDLSRLSGSGRSAGASNVTALQHLHVHDIAISLYDAPLGVTWRVRRADADLDRDAHGIAGHAMLALQAGGQTATVQVSAHQQPSGSEIEATLTPIDPAMLAGLSPGLASLAMLDAPVTVRGTAETGADLTLRHAHVSVQIGTGTLHAGRGSAPVLQADLGADLTPTTLAGTQRLETTARPDGPHTVIAGSLQATRDNAGWQGRETLSVDHLGFADLPALWPEGTGGPGSRPWIVHNIPSGELSDGRLTLAFSVPADLSDAHLDHIDGAIDGHDLTVHWLRPVPPIDHAEGRLTVTDPDEIDIAVSTARQARPPKAGPPADGLSFSQGLVRLTGISAHDQFADISTRLSGSLADLIAVLNDRKVQLLNKRPIPMRDPAGHVAASLSVTHLPLRDDVAMGDLQIATKAQFRDVHLGGIALGRDLDRGMLDLSADTDGLHAQGTVELAGIPTHLDVAMDFRAGPPSQVEQTISVRGDIDTARLAALGLSTRGMVHGTIATRITVRDRRDGSADIAASANLTGAALQTGALGWSKPAGQAVAASLHARLDHDRLAAIDEVRATGPGIDIEGEADIADGQPQVLRLDRLVLAPDTDAHGTVRLPTSATEPYVVTLAGASLDASGVLKHSATERPAPRPQASTPGAPWRVDAQLGRVVLGPGRVVEDLALHAENDGTVIRRAQVSGIAQSAAPAGARQRPAPFRASVTPAAGGRQLAATAPDAGGVLRALDIVGDISGGRMEVSGRYADDVPGRPLQGTATLHDFRVLNAPVIGRVLQAATLYGLIEVLRGPGLGFTTMVAPFRWQDDVLSLDGARAFSASLGFTAKGSADLAKGRLDMQGTIVPAYFFNTLPGRIPLLGKLFSPEKGGGLFAATYAVRGAFDDPSVSVNPLATLTPGILRGLFGLFGGDRR